MILPGTTPGIAKLILKTEKTPNLAKEKPMNAYVEDKQKNTDKNPKEDPSSTKLEMLSSNSEKCPEKRSVADISPFQRFSQAGLWAKQNHYFAERNSSNDYENHFKNGSQQSMAEAYADIIVNYWIELADEYKNKTFHIVDLGIGNGQLSFAILQNLERKLIENGCTNDKQIRYKYLLHDLEQKNIDFCLNHPKMTYYIENGKVDAFCCDMDNNCTIDLQLQESRVFNFDAPIVVIANDFFNKIKQDLFYIRFGQLHDTHLRELNKLQSLDLLAKEHWLQLQAESATEEASEEASEKDSAKEKQATESELEHLKNQILEQQWALPKYQFEWNGIEQPHWLSENLQELVLYYRDLLDHTHMLFPSTAISYIEQLRKKSPQMLLLSTDIGFSQEQELRDQGIPYISEENNINLPVNFHVLGSYFNLLGGHSWCHQPRRDGLVHYAALSGKNTSQLNNCVHRIQNHIYHYSPEDAHTIKQTIEPIANTFNLEQILSFLKLSHYDERILRLFLPRLCQTGLELNPHQKFNLCDALTEVWQEYYPIGDGTDICFELGIAAMNVGHWQLAIHTFHSHQAIYGIDSKAVHNLALCYYEIGELEYALQLTNYVEELEEIDSQTEEPKNTAVRELKKHIKNILRGWQNLQWPPHNHASKQQSKPLQSYLKLQPLGKHHAKAFFYQYRDVNISALTRLPDFPGIEELTQWITENKKQKNLMNYAIMHPAYGFIGSIGLRRIEEKAYFHFWIGTDYQGLGFGQQSALLAFELARETGVTEIYTSAYRDNIRSRHALEKINFKNLGLQAEKPDDELDFFALTLVEEERERENAGEKDEPSPLEKLIQLLKDIDSPIQLKVPG